VLERLDQRLGLLTGGPADAPERQQSLRTAIAWSYDLLSAEEQALFRRLGVFVGGCTLEAIVAVCRTEGRGLRTESPHAISSVLSPQSSILDQLAALVDQSLLRQRSSSDGEPRFTMLETLREFALEQLEAAGEADTMHQLHAAYYLQWAEAAELRLHGPDEATWLARLELDLNNLRAALAWCLQDKEGRQGDKEIAEYAQVISVSPGLRVSRSELGLRLATALCEFWLVRGYWAEGRGWLAAAVNRHPQAAPALRALALAQASRFAWLQANYAQATQLADQSLLLARAAHDSQSTALALYLLGGVASSEGHYAQATRLLEESLILARQIDDKRHICDTLGYLGRLAKIQGDFARAGALYDEDLRIGREAGNQRTVVRALMGLGDVAREQGDHGRAGTLYEESLNLARDLGFKTYIALILNRLGEVARLEQDNARAEDHYRHSLLFFQELGDKENEGVVLYNLGHMALRQHDLAQAAAHFATSLAIEHALGHKRIVADTLMGLGAVAAQREPYQSVRLLSAAAALRETLGYQLDAADRHVHDHYLAKLRAQLDPASFESIWAAGQALSLEDAIAEAQGVADAAVATPDPQSPPLASSTRLA
jgi:hypothetical protein